MSVDAYKVMGCSWKFFLLFHKNHYYYYYDFIYLYLRNLLHLELCRVEFLLLPP